MTVQGTPLERSSPGGQIGCRRGVSGQHPDRPAFQDQPAHDQTSETTGTAGDQDHGLPETWEATAASTMPLPVLTGSR